MSQLTDLIKERYSCRKYQDKPVDKQIIIKLLDTARFAPSAVNYQPWQIFALSENESLQKIWQVYPREWFKTAPVVLMICALENQSWVRADGKNHADIDIAILTDHITLLATEIGLASCWVCNFDAAKTTELFGLPVNTKPLVLLPLGYATSNDKPVKKRKELDEFVIWK